MLKKIPITATKLSSREILSFLPSGKDSISQKDFIGQLSSTIGKKSLFLVNSGLASFFIILEALKKRSTKKEVILPAYTAGSLVVAIKKSGLKPVLCDISLDDFNMDMDLLRNAINEDTLCVLGVHMFGIANRQLDKLRDQDTGAFVVEDCAQSFGTKIDSRVVGNLGDVSFFSFNRGKNIPTYGGGCIATDNQELIGAIKDVLAGYGLIESKVGVARAIEISLKMLALSLAMKPLVYGTLYPLISQFKELKPPDDFELFGYTDFQARIGLSLLKESDTLSRIRYKNGLKIIKGLSDLEAVLVPKVYEDTEPAFNRLPIVFKDLEKRKDVERNLWMQGIETSRMYIKPLHYMFDLGYRREDFPKATFLAQHLLTLPVHPLIADREVKLIIHTIRSCI